MVRANMLAEADLGGPVVIEVLAAQPGLVRDVKNLVSRGYLHPQVHVRSVLRCLDPSLTVDAADPVLGCVHTHAAVEPAPTGPSADAVEIVDAEDPRQRWHFVDGELTRLDVRRGRELQHSDHYMPARRRIRREEFSEGRLMRVLEYPPGAAGPTVQRWIGADGRCFLVIWQQPGERTWESALTQHDGRMFASIGEMYQNAFEQGLRDEDAPVLFSEFRENLPNLPDWNVDEIVEAVRVPGVRRVAAFHSNQFITGLDGDTRMLPVWERLIAKLGEWDLAVVPSERQADDVGAVSGHRELVRVVPQVAPAATALPEPANPDRFVLVARIHRKKRVDEAVEAFALVHAARPSARLEIYGFGYGDELEKKIQQLVVDRGLTGAVEFRGFVEDAASIYRGACATLCTSESEGFALTLFESMGTGVPVVSYDVRYGPREAITDGVDGYVVPWGDRQALADRLLALAADPELRAELGERAAQVPPRFGTEVVQQAWVDALRSLPARGSTAVPPPVEATVRLEVRTAAAEDDTLVLRSRSGEPVAEWPFVAGRVVVTAPATGPRDILDLFVRRGATGAEERLRYTKAYAYAPAPLRAYETISGFLSLKDVREPAPAAAGPAAAALKVPALVGRLRRGGSPRTR